MPFNAFKFVKLRFATCEAYSVMHTDTNGRQVGQLHKIVCYGVIDNWFITMHSVAVPRTYGGAG